MGIFLGGIEVGGGGGGSGFLLGPETNEFTSIALRDAYATNNAAWLGEYDGNVAFLVLVRSGGTATYYRRNNSAWEDVNGIIGIMASATAIAAAVAAAVTDFRTATQITDEINSAITAGVMGLQSAAQVSSSIATALNNYYTRAEVDTFIAAASGANFVVPDANGVLPDPTTLGEIAVDNQGNVYGSVAELTTVPANTGTLTDLIIRESGHPGFIGTGTSDDEASTNVPTLRLQDFFYSYSRHQWRQFQTAHFPPYSVPVDPEDVLAGSNVIWLGEFQTEQDVYNYITAFDSNNSYYAYLEHGTHQNRIVSVTNVVVDTANQYSFSWNRTGSAEAERIAALERRVSAFDRETLPNFSLPDNGAVTGQFHTDQLGQLLTANSHARGNLELTMTAVPSESDTGTAVVSLLHGTQTLATQTITFAGTLEQSVEIEAQVSESALSDGIFYSVTVDTSGNATTVDFRNPTLQTTLSFIPSTSDIELPDVVKGENIPVDANTLTDALTILNHLTAGGGGTGGALQREYAATNSSDDNDWHLTEQATDRWVRFRTAGQIGWSPGLPIDFEYIPTATLAEISATTPINDLRMFSPSLITTAVAFHDANRGTYNATTTYNIGHFVNVGPRIFFSRVNANSGNSPTTDDGTNWVEVGSTTGSITDTTLFDGDYTASTTYGEARIVKASDTNFYISVHDTNLGNDPTMDDGTNWTRLGGSGNTDLISVRNSDVSGTADLITLSVSSVVGYTDGIIVSFRMLGVDNNAGIELGINALTSFALVKNSDLSEFGDSEIEPNSWILARYDDTAQHWVTIYNGPTSESFDITRIQGGTWIATTTDGSNRVISANDTLQDLIAEIRAKEGAAYHDHDLVFAESVSAEAKFGSSQHTPVADVELYDGELYAIDRAGRINELNIVRPTNTVWGAARNAGHWYVGHGPNITSYTYNTADSQWQIDTSVGVSGGTPINLTSDAEDPTKLYVLQRVSASSLRIRALTVSEDVSDGSVTEESTDTFTLSEIETPIPATYSSLTDVYNSVTGEGVSGIAARNGTVYLALSNLGRSAGQRKAGILQVNTTGTGGSRTYAIDTSANAFTLLNINAFITGLVSTDNGFWISERYTLADFRYGGLRSTDLVDMPSSLGASQDRYVLTWDDAANTYILSAGLPAPSSSNAREVVVVNSAGDGFQLSEDVPEARRLINPTSVPAVSDLDLTVNFPTMTTAIEDIAFDTEVTIEDETVLTYDSATNRFTVHQDSITVDITDPAFQFIRVTNLTGSQLQVNLFLYAQVNTDTPQQLVSAFLNISANGSFSFSPSGANQDPATLSVDEGDTFRVYWDARLQQDDSNAGSDLGLAFNANFRGITAEYNRAATTHPTIDMEIYEGRLRFREDDGTISEVVSPSGPHGPLQRYIDDGTILIYYPVYRRFATESEITRPAGGSYAPSTGLTPPTGWTLDAGDLTGEGITVTSLVFVKQDNTLLYADPIRDNIGVDAFINGRLWDTTIVSPINIANLNNVLVYSAVEAASGESGVPLCDVQYIRTDTNAPLTTVAGERSFSSNEHGKLFLTDISSRIAAIRALNSDYAGEINVCITNFKPQNVKGTVSTQDMDYTGINFDTVLARVPAGTNAAQWIYRAPNGKPMIQFHDQRTFNASDISGEQLLVAADLILPDDGNSSRFLSGDSNLYPSINFRDDGRFIFINTSNNDYSNTTVNPRGYQLFGYARYSSGQDYAMDVWIGDQLAVEAVPVGHSWSGGVTFEMRDMFLGTIVMARSIADVPGTAFDNYIGNSWVNLLQHRLLVDPPAYITGSAEASTDLSDMPQSLDAADRGKALVLNATNTAYVLEIILQGTIGDTLTRSSAGVYDVANPFTTSDESELDRLARKTGDHHSDAVRLVTRVPYDAIWDDPSVSGITRVSSELFWADNLEIITQNGLLNATDSISGYGGSGEPTVYAWARNSGNYYVGGDDDRIRFYDVTRRTMFGSAQSIPGEIVAMSIDEADETELFVLYKIDDATMHARNYTVSTTEGNTTFTMGADHALSLADVNAALVANDRRVLFSFNHGEPTDADGLTGAARRGSHLYILINGTIFTRTSGILGAVSILRIAVSGSGTGVTYGAVDPNYFVNIGDFPNVNDLAVFGPASNPEGYWISERYTINEFLTDRLESTDIFGFPDVLLAADRGKALVLNSTNTGYTLEDVLQGTIGNTLSRSAAGVFDVTNPFTQADEDELDRLARQADDSHDDDVKLRHRLSLGDLLTNGYNLGIDYIASAVFWSDDLTIIANNGILSDTETISGYGGSGEPDVVAMARNSGNYYVAGDDDRIRFYDVATQTMFGSAQTMPGDILAMSIDESNETELLVLYKTSDTAVMVRNFTVSATASDDTFTTGTDNSLDKPQIDAVLTANGRRVLNSLHHGDITNQSGVTGLSRRQGYIYLLINGQIFTRTSGILDAISILRMTVSGSGSGLTLGAIDSNFFHGIGDYSNANDLVVYGPGNDPEGYWVTEIGHVDDFERNVIHITDIDGMPDTLVPAERGFSLIQNSTDTGFTLRDDRVATAVYRGRGQTDNLETAVSITPQHGDLAVLRFNEDPDSHRYGGDTIIESLDTPYPQYVIDNMASYAAHRLQSHQVFQALQDGIYDVTINVAGQQFNINQYLEWKLITLGATSDGTIDYTTAGTPLDLSLLNIYSTRMTLVAKEVNLSVGDYFYFMWNTGQGTAFNALYYIVFERKGS